MRFLSVAALLALVACSPSIPDSAAGVGFNDYDAFRAARAADLAGTPPAPAPVPTEPVIGEETIASVSTDPLVQAERAIAEAEAAAAAGSATVATAAPVPAPAATGVASVATNNPNISDEQNFDAVSSRESIESDAARIAANRDARVVVAPQPVPERPSSSRPNIVAFALATTNRVGEQVYSRSGVNSASRFQRNCARYASPDLAQEDFLSRGGPERDSRGLDPDGDGFACFWDPTPFRAARGG